MTADQFRRIALSLPDVEERSHMGHPDFRVKGKVFATLGHPDDGWGMVKLTPAQQRMYVEAAPKAFMPAKGAWGLQGSTMVRLKAARADAVREAMASAWDARARKSV